MQWMQSAGLELHPLKTRVVAMTEPKSHFDFLGYRFWRGKKGNLRRFICPKSEKKFREGLKPDTRRTSGLCLDAIIAKINLDPAQTP